MTDIDYQKTAQLELLSTLSRYAEEYDALPRKGGGGFYLDNEMFGSVDAELCYAMIRHLRPARVVEVGAGWSTLLIVKALEANGEGTITSVDPNPPGIAYDSGTNLERTTLQESDALDTLQPGDVLFADTSHIFVEGHEVDTLLKALPRLPAGVYIHFHDVFLPGGYPDVWAGRGYDEQEALRALLEEDPSWQVVLAAAYLHEEETAQLAAAIRSYEPGRTIPPGSFWIVRRTTEQDEPAKPVRRQRK